MAGLQNASIPNFRLVRSPEYERYELAGEQVCGIIYNGDKKTTDVSALTNATIVQLCSLLDNRLYNITYYAPTADFNKHPKIISPMLNSFETLGGPLNIPSVPRFHNLTTQN
jgi:hypothetical protein